MLKEDILSKECWEDIYRKYRKNANEKFIWYSKAIRLYFKR